MWMDRAKRTLKQSTCNCVHNFMISFFLYKFKNLYVIRGEERKSPKCTRVCTRKLNKFAEKQDSECEEFVSLVNFVIGIRLWVCVYVFKFYVGFIKITRLKVNK